MAAVLVAGLLGRPIAAWPESIMYARPWAEGVGLLTCTVAFVGGHQAVGRRVCTVLSLLVAVGVMVVSIGGEWSSPLGSDVYHAHRSAGGALEAGENPYSDAVTFDDGNPFAPEDRVFVGYPYPPVTLSAYGIAGAFTDPRLISTVAWLGFLGWLGLRAWSSRVDGSPSVSLSALLMMSLASVGSEVWYMAWTEPLTLLLFLVAALTWKKSTTGSGVLLGLALASKQYLILLLPLVALHRDVGWRRRSITAVLTALFTLLLGLLPDPQAFIQATVRNLTLIGFRPDTQSLPGLMNEIGLEVLLPNWVWIGLSLVVVAALAVSSKTRAGFVTRAGLGLGIAFLLGLAFSNYWFLVAGLLVIGTVVNTMDTTEDAGDAAQIPSRSAAAARHENRWSVTTNGDGG
jgi:hypothetical protein